MLKMKKLAFVCGTAASAFMLNMSPAVAQTPEEKGREIFEEIERRGEGFVDLKFEMVMELVDKKGNVDDRQIKVKTLEGEKDNDKTLMVFKTPKDVRGTAFLTLSVKQGDDIQWLYLPAAKKPKRIASKNKSGPFMGSEFSFEDIAGQDIDDHDYKWIRDEACGEAQCFVVESYPRDKYSGYTKVLSWINKEHYRTYKAEFYDRKKSHLKTLTPSGYKLYEDKFWNPAVMEMVNHQTGRSTRLLRDDIKYKSGFSDKDFTKNSLKRAR